MFADLPVRRDGLDGTSERSGWSVASVPPSSVGPALSGRCV